MADKNISIILTADNKTKAGFSAVVKNIKELEKATTQTTKSTKGLSTSVADLAKGFTIATLAANVIQKGLKLVKDEFVNSIKEAINYTNALTGLSSVSAAFGESQSEARRAALELSKDGLMSVTESAEGLKNLLATGFSLPEAINLMNAFKDASAFNRQGTLEFGQAIVGATQGVKNQNSVMVDNVGITKNLSNILKEAGLSESALSEVTSDASVRQALYNGLLKEAVIFQGDAALSAKTLGGQISTLNTMFTMARKEVGDALSPALQMLIEDFSTVASTAGQILLPALRLVMTAFVGLITGARLLGNTISGVIATFIAIPQAIREGSLDPLKNTFKVVGQDYADIMEESASSIGKIWNNEMVDLSRSTVKGIGDSVKEVSEKAKKLAKDIASEIKDYLRDVENMTKRFAQSLNDLVFAHRDKTNALEKDIAKENKAFKKSTDEKKKNFDENMEDLEDRHAEKVSSLESDIADELEAVRLAENQREAFQDDKYLVDINRHKKKVEELKASLEKENNEYFKQTNKLKTELDDQLKDITEQHVDKLTLLQAELAIELEIQKKHAEDFARLKNQVKEDDITRLKNQHALEKAERERAHNERLAELYSQGASEKASYDAGRQGESQQQAQQAIQQASGQTINIPTVTTPTIIPLENIGVGSNGTGSSGSSSGLFGGISDAVSSIWSGITGFFSNLPFFAEGGVVSGSPNEAQLAVVHGGETIIPAGQAGGSVVLNVNIGTLVNSSVERRNFAQQIWLEIGEIAQAQNKTPQELLSI